jgi:hypothetical protein
MEAKVKKQAGKRRVQNNSAVQKPKSKIMQFREKYPEGIGNIVNMRAVLR